MEIRDSKVSDVKAINDLINYYVINTNVNLDYEPKSVTQRMKWYEEHTKPYPILVAEEEGVVLGFVSLSKLYEKKGFLRSAELSIYVNPTRRGEGIGLILMEEIIKRAKEDGKIKTIVSLISSDNYPSIQLHKKMGFEETGCYKNIAEKFNEIIDVTILQLYL